MVRFTWSKQVWFGNGMATLAHQHDPAHAHPAPRRTRARSRSRSAAPSTSSSGCQATSLSRWASSHTPTHTHAHMHGPHTHASRDCRSLWHVQKGSWHAAWLRLTCPVFTRAPARPSPLDQARSTKPARPSPCPCGHSPSASVCSAVDFAALQQIAPPQPKSTLHPPRRPMPHAAGAHKWRPA